jgi:hypothetical protein
MGGQLRGETIVVTDLEKLSRAISEATPEKEVERELEQRAPEIRDALERTGVYENASLGVRISTRK